MGAKQGRSTGIHGPPTRYPIPAPLRRASPPTGARLPRKQPLVAAAVARRFQRFPLRFAEGYVRAEAQGRHGRFHGL